MLVRRASASTFHSPRTPPSSVPNRSGRPASAATASGEVSTRTIACVSVVLGIFLVARVTFAEAEVRDASWRIGSHPGVHPVRAQRQPAGAAVGSDVGRRSLVIGCFFQYHQREHPLLLLRYTLLEAWQGTEGPGRLHNTPPPTWDSAASSSEFSL